MLNINTNYRSLPEQVDFLTDENENNKTDIDNIENDVENLDGRVTQNEDDIDNIENDIEDLQEDVAQNTEDISTLNSEVEAVSGRGGYLIPHNFETATPTENQLNAYALSQIPNITQPEEIFNGTRVTNLYNNHTWILNNTQDTDPVVFEWVDLGQSLVSIATENTLGVVKGSPSDFNVTVNNDGTMSVNGIANALNGKQDKLTLNEVQSGTIDETIGFDTDGNVVRGSAGGSGSYRHNITLDSSIYISLITSDSAAYTIDTLKEYLTNKSFNSINNGLKISAMKTTGDTLYFYYSLYKDNLNRLAYAMHYVNIVNNTINSDYLIISSITDNVTPL